ncbi:MAG: hypothetical protein ACRDL8_03035 [Solirubrobacteraceae bacterium]
MPGLLWYLLRVPRTAVALSDGPAGQMIAQHLACRRWGLPRFRLAQGVLQLPLDRAAYLRGRRRQAVRTNVRRARELGLRCEREVVEDWVPPAGGERGLTCRAATEYWRVLDDSGACVGEAWVTVDVDAALLHSLWCSRGHGRWLLHTSIVERLLGSSCRLLLTNSYDVPLLAPGQQHFQHLLGYSVARLRPQLPCSSIAPMGVLRTLGLGALAAAAIVASQAVTDPYRPPGHRALVWLTALVAVRLCCARAGIATLVGGAAGVAIATLGMSSSLLVSLAYLLCGAAVDVSLSLFPQLASRRRTMSLLGAGVMFLTLAAPGFPTLGHAPGSETPVIPPALGAAVFGAVAGVLGGRLGRTRQRRAPRLHPDG